MTAAPPLDLSPSPGGPVVAGLTALPGVQPSRLTIGLCEPGDPSPTLAGLQPLCSLEPSPGATGWERLSPGSTGVDAAPTIQWRERATGATLALRLRTDGVVELSLSLGSATRWRIHRGGCSPLMGPERAAIDDGVATPRSPILSRALAKADALELDAPPILACDAFRLAFDSVGGAALERWRLERFDAPDAEAALVPPSAPDGAIRATLQILFFGPLTPIASWLASASGAAGRAQVAKPGEDRVALAPSGGGTIHLPSLGIEWQAPPGASSGDLRGWARQLADEGWPGGILAARGSDFPDVDDHAALSRELRSLGFLLSSAGGGAAREEAQPAANSSALERAFDARLSSVALSALRRDPASVASFDASLADPLGPAFALGAFAPRFRFALDGAPRSLRELLPPNDRAPWSRAARMRLAFAPFHAHLRCRELLKGAPAVRPLGLAAEEWPPASEAPPHFLLGEDLLVAGPLPPAGARAPLMLPPGEWLDYYDGARFRQRRQLGLADPMPGRALLLMRAGAILPLFDLGLGAPFATGSAKRSGPSGDLVLKIAPSGEREAIFHDVYAAAGDRLVVPASEAKELRVWYAVDRRGLTLRVAGVPRRLTFVLKWHRPGSVLAGPSESALRPLRQAARDEEFAASPDVWIAHLGRDEALAKTSPEPTGELWLRVEDMAE